MREWLNRADSKSVVPVSGTQGSNPCLSEGKTEDAIEASVNGAACGCGADGESQSLRWIGGFEASVRTTEHWSGDREAEGVRLESVCILSGYRGFESLSLRLPL